MSRTLKAVLAGSIRSGEKARKKFTPTRAPRASNMGSNNSSVVPGYDVDSRTTSSPGRNPAATCSAAATTNEMSGSLDFRSGVGTQMMTTSLCSNTAPSAVASYRPASRTVARSALETSGVYERPAFKTPTRSRSVSSPATVNPARANSMARGRPTYPCPMTAMRAARCRMRSVNSSVLMGVVRMLEGGSRHARPERPLRRVGDASPQGPLTVGRLVVVRGVVTVVTRGRPLIAVEYQPDQLLRTHHVEGVLEEPLRGPVGTNHDDEAVDPLLDDTRVGDGNERWRVDHDILVPVARLPDELAQPRRLEHFIGRGRAPTRRHDGKPEFGKLAHDRREVQSRGQDRVDQPVGLGRAQPKPGGHGAPSKVDVDQQHPRRRVLGERAREIDRGRRLAVADRRAAHGDDVEPPVLALLDDMTKHPVLLGFEGAGLQEADQVLVDARRRHDPPPASAAASR